MPRIAPSIGTVTLALVLAALGCGEDEKNAKKDAGPAGEACFSPGLTANDCACNNNVMGLRTCGQDGIWGACECANALSDGQVCREGQRYICTCPDDSQKIVFCMPGGTIDCTCGDDAGALDAATAGDAAMSIDAATSGNDAGH